MITPPPNGGSAITAYEANCYHPYPSTPVATQTQFVASNPTADVFTFTGLIGGSLYGFTAIAINVNGPSGESPVTLATPGSLYAVSKTGMFGTKQSTSFKPF